MLENSPLKKLIKDPFVHFLLVASLIYLAQLLFNTAKEERETITIATRPLQVVWEESWGRAPTQVELESMITKRAEDEMLFEEALAMGLHKDDSLIYERVLSKARRLFGESNIGSKVDEETLHAYYDANLDDYRRGGEISFSHLFISMEHQEPIQKAKEMLLLLRQNRVKAEDIDAYGDTFIPRHVTRADEEEITRLFGGSLYKQLLQLKRGEWHDYLISSKGIHLFYITERSGGELMGFKEVKEIVAYDYSYAAKRVVYERQKEEMAAKYRVIKE